MKTGHPLSNLRQWLRDIPIQDPLERRMAALVQVILFGFIGIVVLSAIANLLIDQVNSPQVHLVRGAIAVIIIGIPVVLLRRGHFKGSLRFIILLFVGVETYAVATTNLRAIAETLSFFTLGIILAGLLVSRRALLITFVASAGAVIYSALQKTNAGDPIDNIAIAGNFILLNGLISLFLDRFGITLRRALADALAREAEIKQLNASLEQRVQARTAELEATNQELSSFSYSFSHDLRAPLRAISSYIQIIRTDYGALMPPDGQEHLNKIIEGAQKMNGLIEALLSFSRLARGDLNRTKVDLGKLAHHVIQQFQQNDPGRATTCVIPDEMFVTADEKLMLVVLQNLIENAWKFTARTAEARIEIGVRPSPPAPSTLSGTSPEIGRGDRDEGAISFVRDNGIGFNMKYQDKLFGAFQRLHHPDEFPGHGIGLATVQRIIHRHGGRVWAESEPGKGATFYFTLGKSE